MLLKPREDIDYFHLPVKSFRFVKEIPLTTTKDRRGNAGYDLHVTETVVLGPGEIRKVPVNAAFAIPEGYYGFVTPRSGLSSQGVNIIPGIIDSSYRGQVQAIVQNMTGAEYTVETGLRVAQIIFLRHEIPAFEEVETIEELGETVRGTSGFGASGLH